MIIDWTDRTGGKTEKIPIDFDLPMRGNVKIIADWMKTYNQKYDIRYVIMYHAAKKDAPVLEQGLKRGNSKRKNFGMSESGYIYLAANPKMAQVFGDMAHNGNYTVYEVIVPIGKLLPDTGRLQYTTPDGETGRSLAHSLVYAGSARVKDNIERWQIKRYEGESSLNSSKTSLQTRLEQKKQVVREQQMPATTRKREKVRN